MIYNSELVSSTLESGHAFEQTLGDSLLKDKEAWRAVVHGVTKSWIQLSNRTTTYMYIYTFQILFSYRLSY